MAARPEKKKKPGINPAISHNAKIQSKAQKTNNIIIDNSPHEKIIDHFNYSNYDDKSNGKKQIKHKHAHF